MVRGLLALGASFLAGIATVISSLDEDPDFVPFFVGLMFLGGVQAWAVQPPFLAWRRALEKASALVWLVAALWVAALMTWSQSMFVQASGPPPLPQERYLGPTATVYHVIGLFGGTALSVASAFGPDRWFRGRDGSSPQ